MKKRYDFKNHIKGQCIKKYKKVHIEITNICNLKCTFCPPKILPSTTMDISLFERINEQLKVYTKEVAYHIVGDPLIVTRLRDYLNISHKHGLKVNLTTTANNLNSSMYESLMHPALKQVNFSLNSYQANSHKKTLEQYLIPIFDYVAYAMKMKQSHFINLRIWNLDESQSAKTFNQAVFDFANERLNSDIDLNEVYSTPPKNIRVASKVFF
jgi:molybdenum cofactor biosynthesis enzyme MoaA